MSNPRFPVYIISKGRYKRRPTANTLERMNVSYYIVVEEQEYDDYYKAINNNIGTVLILPQKFLDDYDTFWERESDNKTGPGAARNFCWQHSIENGFPWHWVMDDNIESIKRFNNNMKVMCSTGTPFYVMEDFVLRYTNIVQSGMGYDIFCPYYERRPAVRFNTRLYSCQLIRNDIPYRWRGRYNEDTDLSLRILKDGLCTAEFNAFLIEKRYTQSMKGGNTSEFYADEGTYKKSQMLVEMHPDVTKLVERFSRIHHVVDYKPFKYNYPIKKEGVVIPSGVNNYGMKLVTLDK